MICHRYPGCRKSASGCKCAPARADHSDFTLVERPTGSCLLHNEKPMWIVHYPTPNGREKEFWHAYRVKDYELPVPKGRKPWTLDNQSLNPKGFPTLDAAIRAVREAK